MKIEELLVKHVLSANLGVNPTDIIGIYQYGSRMYGTDTDNSDWDFVVVTKDSCNGGYLQYESRSLDIHVLSEDEYKRQLLDHKIMALECYYQENPIMKYEVELELNLQKLRKEISSVVSNSWVKAKKKILIEEESNHIGLKSLFHSFRILDFGTQIASTNGIDYKSCARTLHRIKSYASQCDCKWGDLEWKFKQEHLLAMSEFRKLAPKVV